MDVEAWGRMLGLLELHTDDWIGERQAVLDWIELTLNASQEEQ